jgi:hypothetical protein
MDRKEAVEKHVATLLAELDRLILERDKSVLSADEQNRLYVSVLTKIGLFLRAVGNLAHQRVRFAGDRAMAIRGRRSRASERDH